MSDGTTIHVETVYQFSQSRTPPRLLELDYVRIIINVVANGYHLRISDINDATEWFLGTGCIWQVCQGLLRIIDLIASVEAN